MNINLKYGVIAPIIFSLALLAGCSGNSSDSVPTGVTVTITPPIGDLTYLNHVPSFLDNTATAFYNNWAGNASGIFMQYYASFDFIAINGTSDNGTNFWVGTSPSTKNCNITVSSAFPLCSDWGIAVDRAAGTLTFVNTPVFNDANNAETGAMSGTLTFPPF